MEFFVLEKEMNKNSYFLASEKGFFHRYCNSGFRTKWTGFWLYETKFLEYFAIKMNENWLSPGNCYKFIKSENYAIHFYDLDDLSVNEIILVQNSSLFVNLIIENKNKEKIEVDLELEIAFNIRDREENWHNRTYSVKEIENKIIVNSAKGSACFQTFPRSNFQFIPIYKDHEPIGGLQRCFIPGKNRLKLEILGKGKKEILIVFSFGFNESEALISLEESTSKFLAKMVKREKLKECSFFRTSDETLEKLWNISVSQLMNHYFSNDELGINGFIAGLPWFNQIWGRDSGFIIPAIIDIGKFELAKKSLETLIKFSRNGEIPNVIHFNGNVEFGSLDATPLFLITISKYVKVTGDVEFFRSNLEYIRKSLKWLEGLEDRNGFISLSNYKTWMDTLKREKACIEIQAMYIKALKEVSNLFKILNLKKESEDLRKKAEMIERNVIKILWDKENNYFKDSLDSKMKSVNPVFLPFFGLTSNMKKVIKVLESDEFLGNFGVSAISRKERLYKPNSYHRGSSWFFINNIFICSLLLQRKVRKAMNLLKNLSEFLTKNAIGCLPEAWNSENGSLLLEKPLGVEEACLSQTWSYSTIIEMIEEFFLGINPNAITQTIILNPKLPTNFYAKREKRIGNDLVELTIENKNGKINFSLKSKKNVKYRVILKRGV